MNFLHTKTEPLAIALNAKVFTCAKERLRDISQKAVCIDRALRDFVRGPIAGVAWRKQIGLGANITCYLQRRARDLPLQRILEGALPKIKDSSATLIDPKTNPTGRDCDPPGGQSLCWRVIGSNAAFIPL